MPSLPSPESVVNSPSTNASALPADARRALRSFACDYIDWLPREFVLPVMVDLKDFVAEAADLSEDEALAFYLQNAPLFGEYIREISYRAQAAVLTAEAAACKQAGYVAASVRANVRAAALLEVCRG